MFRAIVPVLRRARINPVWRAFADDEKKKKPFPGIDLPEADGDPDEWAPDELDEIFNTQAFDEDDIGAHNGNKDIPGEKRVFMGDLISGGKPIDTSKWRIAVPSLKLKMVKYNPTTKTYDIVDAMSDQYFFEARAIILGFIGCFSPECSEEFLYDWACASVAFRQQFGFTELVACSMNDPFVMKRYAERLGFEGRMNFIADWNGEWSRFLDTAVSEENESSHMGSRNVRYSGVLMENTVKVVNVSVAQELLYTYGTTPDYLWKHCINPRIMKRIFL